jgi:hypothetical protein
MLAAMPSPPHPQAAVVEHLGCAEGSLPVRNGPIKLAEGPEHAGHPELSPAQTRRVAHHDGETLGRLEEREPFPMAPQGQVNSGEVEPEIDPLLGGRLLGRAALERGQRPLEAGRRLPVPRAFRGCRSRPAEKGHRPRPYLPLGVVRADGEAVRSQICRVQRLHRLGESAVQDRAPERQEVPERDVPHPVVDEPEPVTRRVEHAPSHQGLHRLGGRRLIEAGHAHEQVEVASPPGDGGGRHEATRILVERREPLTNCLAERLGRRLSQRQARHRILVQDPERLERQQGMSLARRPHRFGQPHGITCPVAIVHKRTHERERVRPGERAKPERRELAPLDELVEGPAEARGPIQLLVARAGDQKERPRLQPASEEGEEANAHVVRPVEILDDDEGAVPGREASDEPGKRLEERERLRRACRRRRAADFGQEPPELRPPGRAELREERHVLRHVGAPERVNPGAEWQDPVRLVGAAKQDRARQAGRAGHQLGHEARLADPCFTKDRDRAPAPAPRCVERGE